MIYRIAERRAQIHETCFVADSASVIGSVVMHRNASVWFQAVLRGDYELITVGEDSNIQDGAVLHADEGIPLTLGCGVTVGHMAMLHGCEVGHDSLIGISAVVLNRAKIGKYCIIGARSLVTGGKEIPDRSLVMGSPARVVRQVSDQEIASIKQSARHYVDNGIRFSQQLKIEQRS